MQKIGETTFFFRRCNTGELPNQPSQRPLRPPPLARLRPRMVFLEHTNNSSIRVHEPYRCCMYQGCVRYGTYRGISAVYTGGITGTGPFGKFGTSIPVPDTSVSSVRHQYRYRTLRKVRYDMDTGTTGTGTGLDASTGHFGNFGTSIPVPDTSVSSVQHPRYRTLG